MKKRDAVNRAAHIKANTIGTSNEISFDVLEAAKNQLDGKDGPSNEIVIKKPGKRVGVISLLFSKIAFHSRKNDDAAQTFSDGAAENLTAISEASSSAQKASGNLVTASTQAPSTVGSSTLLQGANDITELEASKKRKRRKRSKADDATTLQSEAQNLRRPLLTQEDTQLEIDRRKKIRRKHRVRVRLAVVAILFVAIGAAGYFVAKQMELHNNQLDAFDSAVNGISAVDVDLVHMDELLANPLLNVGSEDWAEIRDRLDASRDRLDASSTQASMLAEEAESIELRTTSRQVVAACDARKTMFDAGERIFEEASRANSAIESLENIWATVVSADATARSAAELLGSATLDGPMQEAMDRFGSASYTFNEALQSLERIESEYPNLDLSAYKTYLELHINAFAYGYGTANALALRDKNAAYEQVSLYNESDAAAAAAAANLPLTFTSVVEQAFSATIAPYQQSYSEARLAASAADDVIRDYLGVRNK